MKTTRRDFIKLSSLALPLALMPSSDPWLEFTTDKFEVIKQTISIDNLPEEFTNYRIGLLSDIHLGPVVPNEWLDYAISQLNIAKIDLLVLGGDYLWIPEKSISNLLSVTRNNNFKGIPTKNLPRHVYSTAADIISMAKAPDGIIGIFGNHDNWHSPTDCFVEFGKREIKLLKNESSTIRKQHSKLTLIGVDDYWTGIPTLPKINERKANQEVRILLSHNPDIMAGATTITPEFDLVLCGHTHGGQIKLPLIGTPHYNIRDLRFKEGLCRLGKTSIYTTRGLGVVEFPYRINCKPEITVLELVAA